MRRAKGLIAAASLAAAVALAACGDSEPEPSIPLENAQTLVGTLQEIQSNVEVGSCTVAADNVEELKSEIADLPTSVDEDVRQGLENGADQLSILVENPDQCEQPEVTTTEETTTQETTTEATTTTEPTTTEETTTAPPTTTTPTTPPPGGGTGGLGPSGGSP